MKESKIKCLYNNVVSQAISSSGKHIFAGNTFGDIFVHEIDELISTENNTRKDAKIYPQGSEGGVIGGLAFNRDFLIVGATGVLYGLKWCEEKSELHTNRSWEVAIPNGTSVTYFWLNKESDEILVGCDDGMIYLVSLEDGKIVRNFQGHSDLIHCLTGCDGRIYSGSQDGTVLVWTIKDKEPVAKLEPYKLPNLERPQFGKFVGSCAASSDWLICGGGPKLAMWHLRSMECTKEFPFPGKVHWTEFLDDSVIVGGVHPSVQTYTFNGDLTTDVPVSNTAVYSIVWQTKPQKFMSIAGYSNKLRILTDFRYIDSSVDLYIDEKAEQMVNVL